MKRFIASPTRELKVNIISKAVLLLFLTYVFTTTHVVLPIGYTNTVLAWRVMKMDRFFLTTNL
jgi:hypothetical protein